MKSNGIKIFAGYTLILFIVVFGITKLFEVPLEAAEENVPDPAVTTTAVTEPEPDPNAPKEEDPKADNTWALFLVNDQNPIPKEYSDNLDTSVVYESTRKFEMDSRVEQYIRDMFEAASEDGIDLVMCSAYRSFSKQDENFNNSVQDRIDRMGMTEEEAYNDALLEVQLPGHSEHNAGVAADIMCDTYTNMDDDGFKNTEAYTWLIEHCAEYGFILRYPEGKEKITKIKYEPWHYRFVGKYYAKYIMEHDLCLEEFFEEMNWLDEDGKAVYHVIEEDEEKAVRLADDEETEAAETTVPDDAETEETEE